ncbi:hypothetical protein TSAR_004497 [Trichomalopsis sarcophagae]|uniref:Uncharacterized protein n=1 Tax=Trichomalopsis sarcophagae TaxID=543379 RepID=A0A232ENG2_9HYME|nr:hypothetical protein TSAR_004497 [Trichomalopsis sarcophagae]
MVGEKSITVRFISNPEKNKYLIQVLATYFFSSARLRDVYKSVFARSPSTRQILQMRNFIAGQNRKLIITSASLDDTSELTCFRNSEQAEAL